MFVFLKKFIQNFTLQPKTSFHENVLASRLVGTFFFVFMIGKLTMETVDRLYYHI